MLALVPLHLFGLPVQSTWRAIVVPKVVSLNFSVQVHSLYLDNHLSEGIHIWIIGALDGQLLFHDVRPQGPCPRMGLEVKI